MIAAIRRWPSTIRGSTPGMPRIGLVLGGGGVVGQAFHAGVLAALYDATGWDARDAAVIVGTSAGAVVAVELRAGLGPLDQVAICAGRKLSADGRRLLTRLGPEPNVSPSRVDVDLREAARSYHRLSTRAILSPLTVQPGVLASASMPPGRISTEWLSARVRWLNGGGAWPERPLWVSAVRLDSGKRVMYGAPGEPRVDLGDAVAGSCAIPGYFAPVLIDGAFHVDGGAHSPTSADVLQARGLDLVVVSSPMSLAAMAGWHGADVVMRNSHHRTLAVEMARVRRNGTPVVAFEPGTRDLEVMGSLLSDSLDPDRMPAVQHRIRASAPDWLSRETIRFLQSSARAA